MAAEERTAQYEAMFLVPAGSPEPDAQVTTVRSMIERHGGEILVLKRWDERRLAYEINKQKRGVYILALFKAPTGAVTAIERDVNLSEAVLRVMVLKADHLAVKDIEEAEPQPVAPPREDRFDRDRGDRGDRGDRDRGDRGDRGGDRGPRGPRREEATSDSDR